ncbi:MAG: hypothetical protein GY864_04620 [Desulfobacterales bacterium]|nr:hypothetical protein [Desulfobacterales bacterium]
MRKQYCFGLSSLIVLFFFFMISGCGITKSAIKTITPGKSSVLQKQVLIFPLVDRAGMRTELRERINADLAEAFGESPMFKFYGAPKGVSWLSGIAPTEYDIISDPELVKKVEDLGMNAFVTGILDPVESTNKRTGIWPFRKTSRFFEVSMLVNIVDVASGCLYLTNIVSEEITFPLDEVKDAHADETMDRVLEKALPRVLKRQAKAVIAGLEAEPWTGKILDIQNNAFKISAGSNAGISPDQVFTVFDQGKPIIGRDNRAYSLLGEKTGEIEVSTVMEKYSLAVAVDGGPFSAGQIIRVKR